MSPHIFREVDRGHLLAVRRELSINPSALHATAPSDGQTPLHRAAVLGHVEIIRELLSHDARYDIADKFGNTPLHLACQSGELDAVLSLLGHGMRHTLKLRNNDGQTPLHIAVMVGTKEIVRTLVEAGAKVDTKDKDGHAAHDLVTESQQDLIQALTMETTASSADEVDPQQQHQQQVRTISPMPSISLRKGSMSYDKKQQLTQSKGRRLKHLSSSPDKTHVHYNDITQRTLPRKQLQHHEMAIQGLQSELQDLGFRADNIEHFLNESQEGFDKIEELSQCVNSQDRQLAELDQRLMFQESQMRDLRPRVSAMVDENRFQKEQIEKLNKVVDMLQDSAKTSIGSVLEKVRAWEVAAINSQEETAKHKEAEVGRQSEIKNLEKQITTVQNLMTEAKQAADKSAHVVMTLERHLAEVKDRVVAVEDFMKETTATTEDSVDDEDDILTKQQIQQLFDKYDNLKLRLTTVAAHTDKIEEMYKSQMAFEQSRKIEQDLELSKREAKILELRQVALEEENQRRDFSRIQDDNIQRIRSFESKLTVALSSVKDDAKERTELQDKVKLMEDEINKLYTQLEEQENKIKKGRCCVIS
eukprot:g1074.t1